MHPYFKINNLMIPAYGTFMAAGLCLASLLAIIRAKRKGGDPDMTLVVICFVVGGALIGGNLLYLFASYGIKQVLTDIKNGSFAFITSGGLVFYGGLIGGIAGALLGVRITRETRFPMLVNAIVPCIPLGHAIGRVGCLFGGCCYGLPYSGVGAVHLDPVGITHTVFPIQLVEALLNLILCGALLLLERKKKPGGYTLLYIYLICYAVMRFVLEFFRGDTIRGSSMGLSTSQWISLLLLCAGVLLLTAAQARKRAAERG